MSIFSKIGKLGGELDKKINPLRSIDAYDKFATWTEENPIKSAAIAAATYFTGGAALGAMGGAGAAGAGAAAGGATAAGTGATTAATTAGATSAGATAGATGAGSLLSSAGEYGALAQQGTQLYGQLSPQQREAQQQQLNMQTAQRGAPQGQVALNREHLLNMYGRK